MRCSKPTLNALPWRGGGGRHMGRPLAVGRPLGVRHPRGRCSARRLRARPGPGGGGRLRAAGLGFQVHPVGRRRPYGVAGRHGAHVRRLRGQKDN